MEDLIDVIMREGDFHPSEEVVRRLLSLGEEVSFAPKKAVIEYGRINHNVYIVKDGILRVVYFEKDKEETYGFASPGTILLSPHSYLYESTRRHAVRDLQEGVHLHHGPQGEIRPAARRIARVRPLDVRPGDGKFYTSEKKLKYIKGDARERIIAVLKYRPEILEVVSSRIMASYIGVTEAYLCRIKKEIREGGGEK